MKRANLITLLALAPLSLSVSSCGTNRELPKETVYENGIYHESESNDSFAEANPIGKPNWSKDPRQGQISEVVGHIHEDKEGWGLWAKSYGNADYYSYSVMSTSKLEFDLWSVPERQDYDIFIFKLDNALDASYEDIDDRLSPEYRVAASKEGGVGGAEACAIEKAEPGTYYIAIWANDFQDVFNNEVPYRLKITETPIVEMEGREYSIPEGMKNGDKFALWEADYKPFGLRPIATKPIDTKREYYTHYKHPMLRDIAGKEEDGGYHTYAVLTFWGQETIELLYNYFERLYRDLEKLSASKELTPEVAYWPEHDYYGRLQDDLESLDALGFAQTVLDYPHYIGSISNERLTYLKENYARFVKPMYIHLKARMESAYKDWASQIAFRYRLKEEKGHWFIDWSPTRITDPEFAYKKDFMGCTMPKSASLGTITAFQDAEDLIPLLNMY